MSFRAWAFKQGYNKGFIGLDRLNRKYSCNNLYYAIHTINSHDHFLNNLFCIITIINPLENVEDIHAAWEMNLLRTRHRINWLAQLIRVTLVRIVLLLFID